jgi:tRNA/tmRNA/rRNA uracil-C5-methylase (TrmA/RlmC/RlmD family)
MTEIPASGFAKITNNQKQTWSKGDFNEIARQNVVIAEALCEATDPHPGQNVLDVACGSGTAALVAARRYCNVTGIDYVPELIERARKRAEASGLPVDFQVEDAQNFLFRITVLMWFYLYMEFNLHQTRKKLHLNCFGFANQVVRSASQDRYRKGGVVTSFLHMVNMYHHLPE